MAGGTLVTLDWDQLAQPVNDRAGDRVRAQSSGGHRGHHRAPDHGAAGNPPTSSLRRRCWTASTRSSRPAPTSTPPTAAGPTRPCGRPPDAARAGGPLIGADDGCARSAWLLDDDPVQRRVGPHGHAADALLELGRGGGLAKVVGGLPLGDVDVAELRVWVEALVQPAGDEPGLLAHPLGGVLPVSEELLLLAVGTSKALTSNTLMDGSFAVVAWAPPW